MKKSEWHNQWLGEYYPSLSAARQDMQGRADELFEVYGPIQLVIDHAINGKIVSYCRATLSYNKKVTFGRVKVVPD